MVGAPVLGTVGYHSYALCAFHLLLTTLRFPAEAIIRSPASEFQQRNIEMRQRLCIKRDYSKYGVADAVVFLSSKPSGKVVIFTNSRHCSFDIVRKLEDKLDEADVNPSVDVIHIHGRLLKAEKYWRIRLFCRPPNGEEPAANFCALVGTTAVNVGTDNDQIKHTYRFEMA